MAATIIQPVTIENAVIEVAEAATGPWTEVVGASDYGEGGGGAPTNSLTTFAGSVTSVGSPEAPTVSTEINAHNPLMPAHRILRTGFHGKVSRFFQFTTQAETLLSGAANNLLAIGADGSVTFTGTSRPSAAVLRIVKPGASIVVDGKTYTVIAIVAGLPKVAPTVAVAADADYEIQVSSLRRGPFRSRITNYGRVRARAGSFLGTTLELAPDGELPDWVRAV